jgi:hypothetical protein
MGKKKGKAEPEPEVPTGPPPPPPDLRNYVTLQLKLMNWKFTDCSIVVPSEETHLFTIKKRLEAMHGRMKGLVICKDSYAERNELKDDMKTLHEYGIFGAQKDAPPVLVTLFYEFKPLDHDNPLLYTMGAD